MCQNSQEVGLEAAILQRVRNSSLVEWTGTDNVRRLKQGTEAMDPIGRWDGRGAFCERRSQTGRTGGGKRSANAGMSSAMSVRTRPAVNLRFPGQR